jgi:hypothetical protein
MKDAVAGGLSILAPASKNQDCPSFRQIPRSIADTLCIPASRAPAVRSTRPFFPVFLMDYCRNLPNFMEF